MATLVLAGCTVPPNPDLFQVNDCVMAAIGYPGPPASGRPLKDLEIFPEVVWVTEAILKPDNRVVIGTYNYPANVITVYYPDYWRKTLAHEWAHYLGIYNEHHAELVAMAAWECIE